MKNALLKKRPNMLKRVKVWRIEVLATLALGPGPARFHYRVTRLSEQFLDRRVLTIFLGVNPSYWLKQAATPRP